MVKKERIVEKIFIDGSCGSKTIADLLLARFIIDGHVTHYYKDTFPCVILNQYSWTLEFSYSYVCSTNGSLLQKCSAINLSFYLLISNLHDPSIFIKSIIRIRIIFNTLTINIPKIPLTGYTFRAKKNHILLWKLQKKCM